MRHVSSDELARLLPMPRLIGLMRQAFEEHGRGDSVLPDRAALPMPAGAGVSLVMPGALPRLGALGVKVVSVVPGNPARHGRPAISATLFMIDPDTGEVTLSLDGTWITAKRTGAVSGLATDLLARVDAERLVVFGTGPQAHTQIEAVRAVRTIREVVVCGSSPARAGAFIAGYLEAPAASGRAADGCLWRAGDTPARHVAEADIVVAATSSRTPVVAGEWLRPGVHVVAIGAFTPDVRELDTETIVRGRVFVDDRDHAWREAGDLQIPHGEGRWLPSQLIGDLADLVAGRCAGRVAADDITVFKSVGLAIEDVVVGGWVRDRLREA